jgi:hypothetical protein
MDLAAQTLCGSADLGELGNGDICRRHPR